MTHSVVSGNSGITSMVSPSFPTVSPKNDDSDIPSLSYSGSLSKCKVDIEAIFSPESMQVREGLCWVSIRS